MSAVQPVVWSAPVRYAECDQQGVVFNGHYLTYADEGCTAWLRDSYPGMLERGLDIMVKSSTLTWSAPARWGDTVEVSVSGVEVGGTSFTLVLGIATTERPVCEVRTTYVLVDTAAHRPVRVPDDLRAAWTSEG